MSEHDEATVLANRLLNADYQLGPCDDLAMLARQFLQAVEQLPDSMQDCVEVSPAKRGGIPVLRGTRFTVAQVLAEIAEGRSVEEIARDFDLDRLSLQAFLHGLAICLDRPALPCVDPPLGVMS